MHLHRRILLSTGSNGPLDSPPPPLSPSGEIPSHVIIAVASVSSAALFLMLIYYAVLRHRRPPASVAFPRDAFSDSDDHPFWHVKTVGLDAAAIESIGSYTHRTGDHTAAADKTCSVCIGEVLDGEIVRLLPKCGHVFHVPCIDTWLRCHVSCPLCRAAVGDAAAGADGAGAGASPQLDEEEVDARVSVGSPPEVLESSTEAVAVAVESVFRSASLNSVAIRGIGIRVDEEKEGDSSNCTANCSKDEGFEKGQSEIGRGSLFSRLGRARSSSVLTL